MIEVIRKAYRSGDRWLVLERVIEPGKTSVRGAKVKSLLDAPFRWTLFETLTENEDLDHGDATTLD
jgi:hypothetical protein